MSPNVGSLIETIPFTKDRWQKASYLEIDNVKQQDPISRT